MTPSDEKFPQTNPDNALDDGITADQFNRETVRQAIRLDPTDGDWIAPDTAAPLPPMPTNPFLRDCFAAELGWLKRRQARITEDIAGMNSMVESGQWEAKQKREWDDGCRSRDGNANERIRGGLARDFIHTHRLRGMIAGATTQETERDMVEKVLGYNEDATLPMPLQVLVLKEKAREEARQSAKLKALHAQDIFPSAAGLITDDEAARYLSKTTRTLQRMRAENRGPAYTPVGRQIRYSLADLDAYLHSERVLPLAG